MDAEVNPQICILPNRLRLISKELPRNVASFGICIPFGYIHDNWCVKRFARHHAVTSKVGLNHLIEHLVFRGTKNRTYTQINTEMKALVKNGRFEAETDGHSVFFYGTCPRATFSAMADLLIDMVFNSTIPKRAIEKEKKIVLQERTDSREDIEQSAQKNLQLLMYPTHPIRNFGMDFPQDIHSITHSLIKKIYSVFYTPAHAIVVAAGGIDTQELIAKLQVIGPQTTRRIHSPNFYEIEPVGKRIFREKRAGLVKTSLVYGFHCPLPGNRALYAIEIADCILNTGFGSYVKQCIRENPGLAYSIDTGLDLSRHHSMYYVSFLIEHDDLRRVQERFRRSLMHLQQKITDEELELSKEHLKNQYIITLDDTEECMREMLDDYLLFKTPQSNYIEELNAVTHEELVRACKNYLDPSKTFVSMIRPKRI